MFCAYRAGFTWASLVLAVVAPKHTGVALSWTRRPNKSRDAKSTWPIGLPGGAAHALGSGDRPGPSASRSESSDGDGPRTTSRRPRTLSRDPRRTARRYSPSVGPAIRRAAVAAGRTTRSVNNSAYIAAGGTRADRRRPPWCAGARELMQQAGHGAPRGPWRRCSASRRRSRVRHAARRRAAGAVVVAPI